jgi:hypothetical protein
MKERKWEGIRSGATLRGPRTGFFMFMRKISSSEEELSKVKVRRSYLSEEYMHIHV